MTFLSDFEAFVTSLGLPFTRSGNSFLFPSQNITVECIALGENPSGRESGEMKTIFLCEDIWRSRNESVRKRIAAHLGKCRRIMARKCEVRRIDGALARPFLEANHTYGYARSRYKYGMFSGDELVAVSLFSAPRPMVRIGADGSPTVVQSYEWVRHATIPECRISGGMGKMLQHFVRDVKPEEIMSYADLEWSDGEVYERLGFDRAGEIEPVEFLIDTSTFKRISKKKILQDNAYRNFSADSSEYVEMRNLGSIKYLLRL